MDISATLSADLALLTQSLDGAGVDLEAAVATLAADIASAVTSYQGMTITIALSSHNVSFTVRHTDGRQVAGASLLIPLVSVTPVDLDSGLVLYAATPGAFVDLAADLNYALGLEPAELVLDGHLTLPGGSTELVGLGAHVAVNQAIGVLIDRGHTPESANCELDRLAAANGDSLHASAVSLLRAVRGG